MTPYEALQLLEQEEEWDIPGLYWENCEEDGFNQPDTCSCKTNKFARAFDKISPEYLKQVEQLGLDRMARDPWLDEDAG